MSTIKVRPGFRHRLFARLLASMDGVSHELYSERKQGLLAGLEGRILEIGPGTGVNLRYLDEKVEWVGIEPNQAMHPHLLAEAARLGMAVDLRDDFPDGADDGNEQFDIVVSTLVLCSVADLPGLIARIRGVLKPGGKFVFLEHVADRRWCFRWIVQKIMPFTPWRYFSDGCNPGRKIGEAIEQGGFDRVELQRYSLSGSGIILSIIRPHICGVAIKGSLVLHQAVKLSPANILPPSSTSA
jgi:SAM-dependent methyltransferase